MKMGQTGCPETSAINQYMLRNNPEDGRIPLLLLGIELRFLGRQVL
jgi:hypothetical protein